MNAYLGPIPAIRRPISVPVRPHSRPSVFFSAPASAGHAHVPPVRRMMKPKPDVQVGQQIVPPTGPPIPPTVTIAKRPTNIPIGRTYTPQELVVLEKRACATALRKVFNFDLFLVDFFGYFSVLALFHRCDRF